MSLDLGDYSFSADYSLGSATLPSGLATWTINDDVPINYTPSQTEYTAPAPTGNFFDSALKGITSTAETFLGGVSKLYALDNQIQSTKLQQKQIESGLKINELKTTGSLALQSAQIEAQRDLGILQAQTAVANEKARVASSSGASFITMPSSIPWPLIIGGVGLFFAFRKGLK